jgi:hypothetical protein
MIEEVPSHETQAPIIEEEEEESSCPEHDD